MKSEIRQDYVHNRVVIIAPGRASRPHDFVSEEAPLPIHEKDSPFSPANIDKVKAVATYHNEKPWSIKIVKNIFPVVSKDNSKAYGDQEVVIETPDPNQDLSDLSIPRISELIKVYGDRVKALSKDPKVQYILVFKNYGGRAGASIDHAHSQIFATNFLPPHVLDKLKRAEEYRIRYGHCYYCDLIKKEINSPRMIEDNNYVFTETPYASSYNYEAWIFPKRHVDNVSLLTSHERTAIAVSLKKMLGRLDSINLPYNLYLHQVVRYPNEHLYFRLAPRRDVWAGVELGSRLIVNTVAPEDAAKFYRNDRPKPRRKNPQKKK
ncbi:DUF4931 domain-containing protein [Patescibacteria group bacterium]|nr:DUF4931 domain-containing protein [Patescibacteria group bacterium]